MLVEDFMKASQSRSKAVVEVEEGGVYSKAWLGLMDNWILK